MDHFMQRTSHTTECERDLYKFDQVAVERTLLPR